MSLIGTNKQWYLQAPQGIQAYRGAKSLDWTTVIFYKDYVT